MGWFIFFCFAYTILLLFIPAKKYIKLLPIGLIASVILYLIDSTLINLGAYSYRFANPILSGLPTFYLLSGFAEGSVLTYLYPQKKKWKLPYIIIMSAIFLILELVMYNFGYFYYHKWHPVNSFFLNIFGFIVVLWFSQFWDTNKATNFH